MGEDKTPGQSLEEQLRRLDRQRQVVKSILTEEGIDLEPATPPSLIVNPGISRVWATMFGRDGSSLRIARVDSHGHAITRPPCWDRCNTVIKTTNFTAAPQEKTINFERIVDFVSIWSYKCHLWAEFRYGGAAWHNRRYAIPIYQEIGLMWSHLELFIRCQYVKLSCLFYGSGALFDVIGESFPTV